MPKLLHLAAGFALLATAAIAAAGAARADLLPDPQPCADCRLQPCGDQAPCNPPCDPQTPPVQDGEPSPSPCGGPDSPIVEPEKPAPDSGTGTKQ